MERQGATKWAAPGLSGEWKGTGLSSIGAGLWDLTGGESVAAGVSVFAEAQGRFVGDVEVFDYGVEVS